MYRFLNMSDQEWKNDCDHCIYTLIYQSKTSLVSLITLSFSNLWFWPRCSQASFNTRSRFKKYITRVLNMLHKPCLTVIDIFVLEKTLFKKFLLSKLPFPWTLETHIQFSSNRSSGFCGEGVRKYWGMEMDGGVTPEPANHISFP